MKEELRIFFTALMFYTRIPCPKNIDHSPEYINKATRYFPLIGWIVGAISFVVFYLSLFLFDSLNYRSQCQQPGTFLDICGLKTSFSDAVKMPKL